MVGEVAERYGVEMTDRCVVLASPTRCFRCGGWMQEGQMVWVEWSEEIDGYRHRHRRSGLCSHRNRAVEIMGVMEVIEDAKRHPAPEG